MIGEKTLRKETTGAGRLMGIFCLCLKTKEVLAHAVFLMIHPWPGTEERRTGGGQREETGRGWMTARSMPNNIIWMTEGTRPGCQAAEIQTNAKSFASTMLLYFTHINEQNTFQNADPFLLSM